jgi:hypothetical protein
MWVTSLVLTVQAALVDLEAAKGAVLVTNGGLGFFDPKIDVMTVQWGSMGLAIANAAKHKLLGLLSENFGADEITVGEGVFGLVKGTVWDTGSATIGSRTVADHQSRVVTVS